MSHEPVVLVGVDGSAPSLHALDWAAAEAVQRRWRLHVVCAYSLPSFTAASLDGGYAALDDGAIRDGARAVLDESVARVAGCGVEVTHALETGDAAGVLIDLSRQAGLAVVGTRGGGGFADRLLGTVSSALPAHAHCPVVVVPHREDDAALLMPPKRMVVGVDGSPSARCALERAVEEAALWEAELTAVVGVPLASGAGMLAWLPAAVDRDQVLADVTEGLNVAVEQATQGTSVTVKRHALDGSGAELLTEFSTAVDLVIVGSRGRGGFAGMLLGSTSQAVLHHAACPVLVVPNRSKDEGIPPARVPWTRR
ncbi:UspA domain protein [Beutenbergia cavernae DSM 12333]|uniref:UspA domain protein n=1 Tax=Beutenbergia cavernae (strain ATCC BAA-8 / DSM 12333 / CCUG 43141 / JCM 11478 / NBRC 16432 / NCIMB 13614 / HKI 0122) TaxID=471853 RepID=C5BZH3_BEUC1|nr:universal stress protein [Beutenbergia cavernae]ACQ79145.1 UspA domain protein [Beutenbergia cavernae DSM 12333]